MELSNKILSDITVYMKYAKYLPENNRRETWKELVTRNKNMHIKKYPKLTDQIEKAYEFVYDKLIKYLDIKEGLKKNLHRSKVNCYPRTSRIITHKFHRDFPFSHKGAILSLNTCNGYTILNDGTKVDSVANRCLIFDSSLPHASTTCTNDSVRINVNVNFL